MGAARAAEAAVRHVARQELDGYFIHIDADCLDGDVMPVVDYRNPGGLTPSELSQTIGIALKSPKAIGVEITIYNPRLDEDGRAGRALVDALVEGMLAGDGR